MRVICIDDREQPEEFGPKVKKGNIYTVYNSKTVDNIRRNGYIFPGGTYYALIELGNDFWFHDSMFLAINEDQQDELELVNKKEEVV